ncbi:MAG: glutathione S-transferase family protein [Polyangiaceae bacterium]|nr:glutathione S-transferase family protein [Polyangiaceae bacterium]
MKLYYNPVSSYSQKALMALYEKNVTFTPVVVNLMDPAGRAELEKIYPVGKVPVLIEDEGRVVPESSIIIELLDQRFPDTGPRLLPTDPALALETRRWDRFVDCYVNEPMQKVFFDGMRPEDKRDAFGVAQARGLLTKACTALDAHLATRTWLNGEALSLADCGAAPCLSYLRMLQPYDTFKHLTAYAGRLLERPSFVRISKDAEPILKAMQAGR